ncbi:MAG: hypothetical protein Q7U54_20740, partial [Bacteroidales bacterium]|nr:hypothetical protein [Bacteroidales bacterium]
MFKRLQILFLILVPLVFLVIGFKFDRTKYGTDPESAYLFNGLNIAMGKPVGHFDHPGTTVQIYSAVVIGVTHLLRFTNTNLQTDVLTNSELYIEVLRMSFIVFNSLLIFLVGFLAFSSLKNIWLTISLQLTPFLSTTLIEHLATKISPEQLLFSSTILLTILILKHYSSLNKENKWFALLFGLLAGFGMATKFTFLPLLVIPFIVLKGNRNKVVYLGTIIPSFILFTLPAAHDYKVMFKWLLSIASHTGIYGQGSNGIIDAKEYVQSISKICMANKPMLFALLASLYLLIILFVKSRRKIEHVKTPETAYILA